MDKPPVDCRPQGEAEDASSDAARLAAFDQYRSLLFSVAYRMLGSVADAEDMLQETFIRWQQAKADDIQSPRAFLVTIVSRLCLKYLDLARVRREQYVGEWLPEPLVVDPRSDPLGLAGINESLSMAFLVLLERLTPVERAVFLLREVFEYEYSEISAILSQTEANCRQILRRARQHVRDMRLRFQASPEKQHELLEGFLRAASSGDVDGLISLLADDVVLHTDGGGKAVAVPNAIRGARNVAHAIVKGGAKFTPAQAEYRVVSVNGAPGVVGYSKRKPWFVLTLEGSRGRIRAIYFLTNPDKLLHLPALSSTSGVDHPLPLPHPSLEGNGSDGGTWRP